MAAPTGTWTIFAAGAAAGANTQLVLVVNADGDLVVNATGSLTATNFSTMFGNPISATWDDTSQTIQIARATEPNNAAGTSFTFEVYTGTLFPPYDTDNFYNKTNEESVPQMLAGTFDQYANNGSITTHGWYAVSTAAKVKEAKDGAKDGKDGKESTKDGSDKGGHLEKPFVDKTTVVEVAGAGTPTSLQMSALEQLTLRVAALEQRLALGQAFIGGAERPPVGESVLRDSARRTS